MKSQKCRAKDPATCRFHGDRYNMSRMDQVTFINSSLVRTIWEQARLEGIGVTIPDTATIMNGDSGDVDLDILEKYAIVNLKRTWQWVVKNLDKQPTFDLLMKLNELLGQGGVVKCAGDLRTQIVHVLGMSSVPPIPDEEKLRKEFDSLKNKSFSTTDYALNTWLFVARTQMFYDGNKRTATMMANMMMAREGHGILIIPNEERRRYLGLVVDYYNDQSKAVDLKRYLRSRIEGYK